MMLDDSQLLKSEPAWMLKKWSTLCVFSQEGGNPLFPKVKEQMGKPEEFTTARACWRGDEQYPGFVAGSRAGQLCAQDSSAEGMSCTGGLNRCCLKQEYQALDSLTVIFETYLLIWLWSERTEGVLYTGSSELSSVSTRASWCSPLPPSWAVPHHFLAEIPSCFILRDFIL